MSEMMGFEVVLSSRAYLGRGEPRGMGFKDGPRCLADVDWPIVEHQDDRLFGHARLGVVAFVEYLQEPVKSVFRLVFEASTTSHARRSF
jgi:hypothetical protein